MIYKLRQVSVVVKLLGQRVNCVSSFQVSSEWDVIGAVTVANKVTYKGDAITTVLRERNMGILSASRITRSLVTPSNGTATTLTRVFNGTVLSSANTISEHDLKTVMFSSTTTLRGLGTIARPLVTRRISG